MSTFNPEFLKSLGAMLAAAPGSESAPAGGGAPPGAPPAPGAQPGAPQGGGANIDPTTNSLMSGATAVAGQARDGTDADSAAAMQTVNKSAKDSLDNAKQQKDLADSMRADNQPTLDGFVKQLDNFDQQFAAARDLTKQRTAEAWDRYMATTADFSKTRIYNWWSEAGTGAKVLGAISQVFAGALQGLNHGMGGQTPLDKIIANDLERQKMGLQQKGEIASNARNTYQDLLGEFKDEVSAEGALKEVAYNSTLQRMKVIAQQTGKLNDQNYLQAVGAIQQKVADNRKDVLLRHAGMATNAAMGEAGVMSNWANMFQSAADKPGTALMEGVPGIPGSQYLGKESKADLGTRVAGIDSALRSAKQLHDNLDGSVQGADGKSIKLRDQAGSQLDFMRQNKQLIADIVVNAKDILHLRGLQAESVEQVEKMIGSSDGTAAQLGRALGLGDSYGTSAKRVENFIKELETQRKALVRSKGIADPRTGQVVSLESTDTNGAQ